MKDRVKSIGRSIALTIFIAFSFLVLSCDKKKDGPNANFINQINFKKVQFMDLSNEGDGKIVRWEWNLGDGTTSTEEHPLHTYSEINTYTVSLAVTDENDLSDAITKEIAIPNTAVSPIADFSYFQSAVIAVDSLEVTFTDGSEAGDGDIISWAWDFGDNTTTTDTSTLQNPIYMYILNAGYQEYHYFTVSLSITDEFGSSHTFEKDSVSVNNPKLPTVDFDEEINILEVIFTAFTTSDGEIISYHWDFGDTTTVADTSDLQSSTYTYPAPGIYPVSLTVIDSYGLSAGVTTNISVYPTEDPPSANFIWETNLLQVTFTDLSVAGDTTITNWSWNFGDGDTSTEQNVVYTYTSAGTYSVSLTVTDANGLSNISTQSVTVTSVLVGPTANFTHSNSYLIIQFTDASQAGDGVINNWSWDFGNGSTSTEQNPVHEYATADTFIVSLTVMDVNNLTDTYSGSVITVEYLQIGPSAAFEYSIDNYTVTFTDFSSGGSGTITGWSWNFGDGSASTEQNPVHTYSSEGIYNVNLTVTASNDSSDSHSEQVVLGINFTAFVNASGGGDEYDLTFGFSPLTTDGFDASHCLDSQGNTLPAYTNRTTCLSGPDNSGEFGECPSCVTPTPYNLSACESNGCTWVSIHTWVGGDTYAPPAPPPPAFDAALAWDNPNDDPDVGFDRFYTQILSGLYADTTVHVYDIQLQYPIDEPGAPPLPITISWDNTGWSDLGTFVLQDAFGGAMINVDMTIETSLELTNPAFNLLKLKVTPAGSA
ncbi:MAG TPA: PKD domain-containing protein, partial [Candidatus Marinimicrobia bacterium]|nr:PKD domain-containing protein [Candidatus Neomarinimicrobiota bacterium]